MKAGKLFVLSGVGISLILAGCGKKITSEEARSIALKDAGLSEEEVTFTSETIDDDSFGFEFHTDTKSYDYEIDDDGTIAEKETKNYQAPSTPQGNSGNQTTGNGDQTQTGEQQTQTQGLTQDEALAKAVAHFGVDGNSITNVRIKQKYDDGRNVYDIDFYYNNKEYSFEIDINTSEIISTDIDNI